ncbi:MAG: hypothetical protein MK085_00690 [Phycisphaerales bacterium]|nr:hypothetical protein [Phycisphaerales bacterium]
MNQEPSQRESDHLSSAGKARRDAMLGELQDTMLRMHRNRRRRRAAGGMLACVVAVALVSISLLPQPGGNTGNLVATNPDVLAIPDVGRRIDIAPATPGRVVPSAVEARSIRIVAIETNEVLRFFADQRVAVGVRCAPETARCEIFFPGRDSDEGLIIR